MGSYLLVRAGPNAFGHDDNSGDLMSLQTGWMMWNWLVSVLAVGGAIVLYDGSPLVPHVNILWDIVDNIGLGTLDDSCHRWGCNARLTSTQQWSWLCSLPCVGVSFSNSNVYDVETSYPWNFVVFVLSHLSHECCSRFEESLKCVSIHDNVCLSLGDPLG